MSSTKLRNKQSPYTPIGKDGLALVDDCRDEISATVFGIPAGAQAM
jgi:hypothetical protein